MEKYFYKEAVTSQQKPHTFQFQLPSFTEIGHSADDGHDGVLKAKSNCFILTRQSRKMH